MESEKVKKNREQMLKDYLSSQLLYVNFTSYIENKIKNILIENEIKYQSLSSRVKSYDSLEKKLTEGMINLAHKDIKRINDLSGVRVIFYDEEELIRFNNIIYDEFSVIKYKPTEDIMRYDGTNITVKLKNEINKFKGLLCEIQLTTVLSHAINEFGHDILYKDIDELQAKNDEEYAKIKEIFETARKDILKVVGSLEVVNRRAESIKNGAKNIDFLLDKDFSEKLQNVKSVDELEDIINKMIKVIPIVNKNEEKYQKIYDSGIIYSIVKKFSKLPVENTGFLNYDTYEYKFENLLEFLKSYKYLWLDDFRNIIIILHEISINNNIADKFNKFIENLIIADKADSIRGYGNYAIHETAYTLINDKKLDEHIRIKLIESFCNVNYNYCEEVEINKINYVNNKIDPNEIYKNKIYKSINELLSIFFNSRSNDALNSLININCDIERNSDIFEYNPIYKFFSKNYDKIDIYSKNELYKSVCCWKNIKLRNSRFYKKIKEDKVQQLYAMLFNYWVDEIPGAKYDEKEEFRNSYLKKYINDFKNENIDEIFVILNAVDKDENSNPNIYRVGKFLIEVGAIKKHGKEIIKNRWNEYILLGIIKQDENYKYKIDDEIKADKIIEAMIKTDNADLKVLNKVIKYAKETENEKLTLKILKLIINNTNLVNNNKCKKYLLEKLEEYNTLKTGVMEGLLYSPHTERAIIEEYSHSELKILLDNFNYGELNRLDEYFLNELFEKYPDDLRMFLRKKAINNPNNNLNNSFRHNNLTNCKNYKKERYKNLILCMEILEKNDYYKVSNYIDYLLGEYDDELGNDIIKYLNENDNYDSYTKIIDLCRLFDASTSCWRIFEFIISKVDENDKILHEIDCLLFNTGVVHGEYGIVDSFYKKYIFFKENKSENKKVKEYIKKEAERFKILYQNEKNKRDKEKIMQESKYELEKEKVVN